MAASGRAWGSVARAIKASAKNALPCYSIHSIQLSRIAVLPPSASFLFQLADVQTLSLSSFYCFIDNLIRLIVTMFQL
ncbi:MULTISPECIES: hypothetical protein [Janthinobacterium]|uniref:hypothetical protein n=1 Tax=Janthinobacterium TaxID=29580 RepID=UPI000B04269F|nr:MULTISPECIES: hypothetical protein [Janthinobacterium]MCC7696132.1 hypothetical protein [Janthinobacterium sp. EB271-G4-7A]MCC7717059.1 hypothetical protein [Janthinobacterium lividum]WQE27716.1 hypothetical protein U0004_22425 [Janthinobacterium lividum]